MNFDMDIVNLEFSCPDQLLVLPKYYGTLNSEYHRPSKLFMKVQQCKDFSKVHYMHFTAHGKPWTYNAASVGQEYKKNYPNEVLEKLEEWMEVTHGHCPNVISKAVKLT